MYITIDEAKKHLNVDDSYKDDDTYIGDLIKVAEDSVAQHLDIALDDLVVDGVLPSAISHSILLMVGNLYANREPVAYSSVVKYRTPQNTFLGFTNIMKYPDESRIIN